MPKRHIASATTYLAEAPLAHQAALKELRRLCRDLLPGYREEIDYGMPVYKRNGVMEVAFASHKHYISLYILKKEVLDAYRASLKNCSAGKGCIRFKHPEKIDFEVVKSLLRGTFESDSKPC